MTEASVALTFTLWEAANGRSDVILSKSSESDREKSRRANLPRKSEGTSPSGATSIEGSSQRFFPLREASTRTRESAEILGGLSFGVSSERVSAGVATGPPFMPLPRTDSNAHFSSGIAYPEEITSSGERTRKPVVPSGKSTVRIFCETKS